MNNKTFIVDGMSCSGCVKSVQAALIEAGASEVQVDLAEKTVAVRFDESVSEQALVEAIEDVGFELMACELS